MRLIWVGDIPFMEAFVVFKITDFYATPFFGIAVADEGIKVILQFVYGLKTGGGRHKGFGKLFYFFYRFFKEVEKAHIGIEALAHFVAQNLITGTIVLN